MSKIDVTDIIERLEGDDCSYRDELNAAKALRLLAAEVAAAEAAEHLRKDEPHAEFRILADARAARRAALTLPAQERSPTA